MKYAYFASSNENKMRDIFEIVDGIHGLEIYSHDIKVSELQSLQLAPILRDKLIKSYWKIQQPVIVDHTALYINALAGLPGVQAGLFWKKIGPEACKIVRKLGDDKARVEVGMSYTDGDNIFSATAKRYGKIAEAPRGSSDFDWDSIFIPSRSRRTYAEMDLEEKLRVSPRAVALRDLANQILNAL